MKHFTLEDLKALEQQKCANLINSCTGFKSANLISTKSKKGITNVAVLPFQNLLNVNLINDPKYRKK